MDKPKKRIFTFESLEERELLSVSPLLYGVHSFVDNTPVYVAPSSSSVSKTAPVSSVAADLVTSNNPYADFLEDRNLADDLSDTDWHNVSTMSAEGEEEECEFGGTVSVSTETSEVEERMGAGIVTITRTDDMPGYSPQLTAKFSLTGTATPGIDYSVAGLTYNSTNECYEGEIVLYAGETSASLGIINDAIQESSETVIFTLLSVNNIEYEITSNSATVTIIDDDDWTVTGSGGGSVWERAPSDPPSFEITRSSGLDRTYGITTEFTMSGNAAPCVDFGLAWSYGNDPETAISLLQYNGVWKGSVYFPANTTDDIINVYVIPINDALPEDNETVTLSVTNAYANPLHPFTANGNGTFTILDDDDWKISLEVTDDEATERISDVEQDYGEFKIKRTYSGVGEGDKSYGITAVFDMIYASTDTMSAQYGSDYSLQYQNTNGQWITLDSPQTITAADSPTRYRFGVTILAGQTEVKMRLVPNFDWQDEAELFDPFGNSTPKDDEGEKADIEIISASWSGMGDSWNPLGEDTEGQIEIKDGAFVSVTSDFDNNGTINKSDYDVRHGAVGSLVLFTAQDIAAYYAWIDVISFHEFALNFQGSGGIEYVYSHNNNNTGYSLSSQEILTGDNNLAMGTVTVAGANNSPTIMSGSLSLTVGGGSDWTRFSVFSVTVDMAFNHDRSDNTGSDGINIRTSGTTNTEHYGPELIQNTSAGWDTLTDGAANQKTVLYLKNNTVTIYNRFAMSLVIPFTVSLDLRAAASVSIGGCTETTVTFENGVSNGNTKEILGVDGFRAFSSLSSTFNGVNKEQGTFDWNVTKIVGKSTGTGKATTTAEITFYTILDVPQDPWNPADTTALDPNDPSKTISVDDKYQPWATALEFTIQTAATKGKNSDSAALSQLTTFLHSGYGLTYDTTSGAAKYADHDYSHFNATAYIVQSNGNKVNCYDQAAAITTFGRLLGTNVQFAFSDNFGYINTTILVGNITTNNPFFNMGNPFSSRPIVDITSPSTYTYRRIVDIDSMGMNHGYRSYFGNHAYAVLSGSVYDACGGPVTGSTLDAYFNSLIDFDANKELNLFANEHLSETSADLVANIVYYSTTILS